MSANFSEETSWSNVPRNGLAGFQVQSQKQTKKQRSCTKCRNCKAMYSGRTPNEQTLYKQGMLLFGSHIVTSRERGKVAVYKSYCSVFFYQV